jgi:hypothetical protein
VKQYNIVKRMKPLLGTYVEIGFVDNNNQSNAFNGAFSCIKNIQTQMSFHNTESTLSKLNHSQGEWIELPKESIEVLSYAKQLFIDTEGLFNCTLGGHLVQNNKIPNHFNDPFIPVGSGHDIEISLDKARLLNPVIITLDGIAKGYAVDQAIESLIKIGISAGWVNAGGDIRVFGDIKIPIHQLHDRELYPKLFVPFLMNTIIGLFVSGVLLIPAFLLFRVQWDSAWLMDLTISSGDSREWITVIHALFGWLMLWPLGTLWSLHMRTVKMVFYFPFTGHSLF